MRYLGLALLCTTISLSAQEKITLTTPEAKPSNTGYVVERMTLDVKVGTIYLQLEGDNRETVSCLYSSQTVPTGRTLITGLNKANLSTVYAGNAITGSLLQRLFHRLVVMGESTAVCGKTLIGSLTGAPG